MARKLVLLVALISAMGMGCGWLAEDMCSLGGSYADDPSTPIATAEFALPAHSRTAPKAVISLAAAVMPLVAVILVGSAFAAPETCPSTASPLQNPRRC